ncbi:MAG: NYN domain-containing protein [Kiritimatiellae bacterium]|nr:NYN domain-containing protein [Kiritimatiellia bacterium]
MPDEAKIALLIDCDNVSHKSIQGVIDELSQYGTVNIRRAYGNWKSDSMKGWEEKLHPNAIIPIQQFAYTSGKNATDSAIIIDAMDLLYSKQLDAFALMTSDSDFTPLAMRIRAEGKKVYGFGAKKTPEPFVNACSQFIYTEKIEITEDESSKTPKKANAKKTSLELKSDSALLRLLRTAVEKTEEDDGWSHLGMVGQYISNNSSFSPINYGYKKLSDIIRVIGLFNIEMRDNNSTVFVRKKK